MNLDAFSGLGHFELVRIYWNYNNRVGACGIFLNQSMDFMR